MNAPAGFLYPGDAGSAGRHRLEQAVAEPVAARRPGVGCARRRPHGGALLVRDRLRLPDRRIPVPAGLGAALRQPLARRDPPDGWTIPYAHLGGDPHPITIGPDTEYIPFGTFGVDDPGHQLAADPVVERDARTAVRRRLGRRGQLSGQLLGSAVEQSRSTPASTWASAPARSTAWRTRCAAPMRT